MNPSPWLVFLFSVLVQTSANLAYTDSQDIAGLTGIAANWNMSSWMGNDPCGDKWIGIICTGNRVTSIRLSSVGLSGTLSGDIQLLAELTELNLSYNEDLGGSLTSSIGSLSNLQILNLAGCSFSGELPKELGQLSQLVFLYMNSNRFTGHIPAQIGSLLKLYWLDLTDNQLTGRLPVFDGINPGLDNLTNTKHFHFGQNQLSGPIPSQFFSSGMRPIHLLLDNNDFSGSIPPTLGLLNTLEILRLDNNYQLTGTVPSNINNLTSLGALHLANNKLTGPLPNLTGMVTLNFVDLSNNSFSASSVPTWFTNLPSLTSLYLEKLGISGHLPQDLFAFLQCRHCERLRDNQFNGTLDIESDFSTALQLIDLQDNQITDITSVGSKLYTKQLILFRNPICNLQSNEEYCTPPGQSNPKAQQPYSTPMNCIGMQPTCPSNQILSPSCSCSVPYRGTLFFRGPSFSDLTNSTRFVDMEEGLKATFIQFNLPVDSVSIHNMFIDSSNNLQMNLDVFPSGKTQFGVQDISNIGFILSNQTYKPPNAFGPYFFLGQQYYLGNEMSHNIRDSNLPLIVGVSAAGAVVAAAALALVIIISRRKRSSPKTNEESEEACIVVSRETPSTSTVPQPHSAQIFSLDELKNITNNFSDLKHIGTGGYGKVYKGTLLGGQLVAVKRMKQGSHQGRLQFTTEIELLSRVHHKNIVSLVGYCLEKGERILVYEYVTNGTLQDSLTGKSSARLDWRQRLRVVLDAAKGISYLHESANLPIVHGDIKSSNILLDEQLNAKVSDFGLSKPLRVDESGHVTSQAKGTWGYVDPEYCNTNRLTVKSDVYSFGVLMLEVITATKPELDQSIVHKVNQAVDGTKKLYGLQHLLDSSLAASPSPLGELEQYVDLALRCVENGSADRPSMGEVVSEIERMLKMADRPPVQGADDSGPYRNLGNSFYYSGGGMPWMEVEPK